MKCVWLLGVVTVATQLSAQTVDSSLVVQVDRLLQAELRGGGWRDTLAWQPRDSGSAALLRLMPGRPQDAILPPGGERLLCPGSTDLSGTPLPPPVGYGLRIALQPRGRDSATVTLEVACTFVHRGRPRGFSEGKTWQAVRGRDGWRLRLLHVWTT